MSDGPPMVPSASEYDLRPLGDQGIWFHTLLVALRPSWRRPEAATSGIREEVLIMSRKATGEAPEAARVHRAQAALDDVARVQTTADKIQAVVNKANDIMQTVHLVIAVLAVVLQISIQFARARKQGRRPSLEEMVKGGKALLSEAAADAGGDTKGSASDA